MEHVLGEVASIHKELNKYVDLLSDKISKLSNVNDKRNQDHETFLNRLDKEVEHLKTGSLSLEIGFKLT